MLGRWLLFIHILSAVTFFLGHGAGAAMAFKIRKENSLERIRTMLELSNTTIGLYLLAFLILGITGLVMPFQLKIWNKAWVWISIALMLFVFFWMYWYSTGSFKALRKLVGMPYRIGNTDYPAEEPASIEVVTAHIQKINIWQLVVVGYIIPAVVLWLMVFKPF